MVTQAIPFMEEMGIPFSYGLTQKDNILFWLYDCAGVPDPHTSFETRSILYIDHVAKCFQQGSIGDREIDQTIIVNECWHDIYECKKEIMVSDEAIPFVYLRDDERFHSEWKIVGVFENTFIPKKKNDYNYFRWNIPKSESCFSVLVDDVKAEFNEFTFMLFDFQKRRIIFEKNFSTKDSSVINFAVNNVTDLAACFYSGIRGKTSDKEIEFGKIEIRVNC